MKYPIRHNNHTLGIRSEIFFLNHLPHDWNVISVDAYYGQDLKIEICEDNLYKGPELIVQLKALQNSDENQGDEHQTFRVSTYNYMWNNLRMVMQYIAAENEAYYILLKGVPSPDDKQETFTVRIPRRNRLSQLDWSVITDYVREVTTTELQAMRMRRRNQNR